jgi:hypothetical protein
MRTGKQSEATAAHPPELGMRNEKMGFMQSTSGDGEDFKVYVKYNAKAGRWYTKEDKPDAQEFEVTDMTAVFDFANLKTGWFLFAPGVAPVKQLNDDMRHWAVKPSPDFKQGFQINLFSNKNLLGVREFASTAGAVIDAMNDVYDRYADALESRSGKLPIVKCISVKPIISKHGTNYSPVLEIVGWTDRPAELAGASPVATTPLAPAGQFAPAHDLDDDVPF